MTLLADFLRFLTTITAAGIAAMTVRIIQTYYALHKAQPGRRGLLPRHVWMIGLSYLGLMGFVTVYDFLNLGHHGVAPAAISAVLGAMGCFALYDMLRYQGLMMNRAQ